MFVVIIARISQKPAAQSSTFQHLQMVEFKPCVSKQARMLSAQLSIEKKVWNMLRQLDESLSVDNYQTNQSLATPRCVHTVSVHTVSVHNVSVHTAQPSHS